MRITILKKRGAQRGAIISQICVLSFAALLAGPAWPQIAEGGDIHWETEWNGIAPALGWNPATYDSDGDGILDAWSFALAEAVITSPAIPGHTAGLVDLFNANLAALETENAAMAAQIGHLAALTISMNGFNTVNTISQMSTLGWTPAALTSALYDKNPILYDTADLDGDFIQNDHETGATDAASYIAACTTSNLVLQGDIPWETQFAALAQSLSADPGTFDMDGEGIPDFWEFSLAEAIITDPAVIHHSAAMRETYNANLLALAEHPKFAQAYCYLAALGLSMGNFETINVIAQLGGQPYSGKPLTEALYNDETWLHPNIDLDGDQTVNYDELGATDAASYVLVCTTSGLVLEGDIPWESQWNVLAVIMGVDPETGDVGGDGVPDYWQFALAEAIITNPLIVRYTPALRELYNANLQALSEHEGFGPVFGYLAALFISMGEFDAADFLSQLPGQSYSPQPLTASLYSSDPWLYTDADLDDDLRRNTDETGATDAESYIAACTTSSVTETNIPWEEDFIAFVTSLTMDYQTADLSEDGIPDYWQFALAEAIITNEAVVHHSPKFREMYDANVASLLIDCPGLAYTYGHLTALLMCMNSFGAAEVLAGLTGSCTLTESLYQAEPVLEYDIDLDGDGFINVQEPNATDVESYVTACITSAIPYPLGLPQDLLDNAFYGSGFMALTGTVNNAGTQVAFLGSDISMADISLYLVDIGSPSSWRLLASDFTSDFTAPLSWTPDDSAILQRDNRFNLETVDAENDVTLFAYRLRQPVMTYKSQANWLITRSHVPQVPLSDFTNCVSTSFAAEFASEGDIEGWIPGGSSWSVAGGVLSLVGANEQVGMIREGLSIELPSDPCLVIRANVPASATFNMIFSSGTESYWMSFDANVPGQMNAYVISLTEVAEWAGTISSIFIQTEMPISGTTQIDYVRVCQAASFPAGNTPNLVALPILPNGRQDDSRQPVALTCFEADALQGAIDRSAVSANGNALSFVDYKSSPSPAADLAEIYVVKDVHAILAAPVIPGTNVSSLAPQTLGDQRVVSIRAHDVPDNFVYAPAFSQDGSLVIYTEDWNNITNGDEIGSLFASDFDLMVSRADGTGEDFRINAPGNRAFLNMSRGGTRVVYTQWPFNSLNMHLYIAALDVQVTVEGVPLPGNDTLTTDPQEASDGSGTILDIPANTTIDFPEGVTPEIRMSTPLDPATPVQMPPPEAGFPAAGIPVVREFGPQGTVFSQPIVVTITYTDAEIEGLDEANLRVYLYNEETEIFDLPVTTIIERDLANNSISFTLSHFSTFGVGSIASMMVDADSDGVLNDEDLDDDGDGLSDDEDPAPLDSDNDGEDNDADEDDDGDGIVDTADPYLFDTDNDGDRNQSDLDDDNDTILDSIEGWDDIDGDGIGNQLDTDSDGDGFDDIDETQAGSDPYDQEDTPLHSVPLACWPAGIGLLTIGVISTRRRTRQNAA